MSKIRLECTNCKKKFDLSNLYFCDECNGILEVIYNYDEIRKMPLNEIFPDIGFNIWRYKHFLPVEDTSCMISLLEGGTPLIESTNLSKEIGLANLFFKDETRNPTGSFKDRAIAVGISKAKEMGLNIVTTASSGNGAGSLATYAAKAQFKSYVFVPEKTPTGKIAQALTNGSTVLKIRGNYSDAYQMALFASRTFNWANITTTFINPYAIEGDKTVSYEIFFQLKQNVPDWIFIPTGAGPLVFAIWKGFIEINKMELTQKMPRIVAVQAEGCSPIVKAFESNQKTSAWKNLNTTVSSIADPLTGYESDGDQVLKVIKATGGLAVSVSDKEILDSVLALARYEGIYSEPGAAAAFAGFKKIFNLKKIKNNETCVCVITGTGLKDPDSAIKGINPVIIEARNEELLKYLEKK